MRPPQRVMSARRTHEGADVTDSPRPWTAPMPDNQFELMREILGAPSPVGLEGAMTHGVIAPYFEKIGLDGWKTHTFQGNAGVVLDTAPGHDDMTSVMIVGHADKIRLQVRSIGEDGKIWVNSDSFLATTCIGHEVLLFSKSPDDPRQYRVIEGGTVEALGAIHFSSPAQREGKAGVKKDMLYLELQIHGDKKKEQVEALGIRPGDPLILKRKIRRGFSPDTFYGAYLDNGLGCFVAAEVARLVAERGGLKNIRLLAAMSTHEEIGRMGSRVMVAQLKPDVVIATDVNHDYDAAPGVKERRFNKLAMGEGVTLSTGAIASEYLNGWILETAAKIEAPVQHDIVGRDTGTDAMAAVFAGVDAASTSIGFPIRNMHTISETGHTADVIAAIHLLAETLFEMDAAHDGKGVTRDDFRGGHPRLDFAKAAEHVSIKADK